MAATWELLHGSEPTTFQRPCPDEGKTVGGLRQTVFRGMRRVDQQFKLTMTASNLVRMARILSAGGVEVAQ